MAVNRLKAAINAENSSPPVEKEDEDEQPMVSMADRALPLINLFSSVDSCKIATNVFLVRVCDRIGGSPNG
ncbi:hypothetical protein [Nitrosomonas sp.]|uniref:hypothetical protein n=1 Tax=Nitrosomonas sp. TaxID=42353 RepID=UPI00351E9162